VPESSYALAEAMDEGYCGLPVEELVPLTEKLLEVPAELVETALNLELELSGCPKLCSGQ
jgi:exodeoxyribonuclease V alpha subunit